MVALFLALLHVPTWMYANFDGYNADWSAARFARYATFAEFSEYDLPRLTDYKRAGGRHAAVYIDPSFVPYCVPPFTAPAGECKGPFGDQHPPESAWLHQANGERVRRGDSYTHQYQEALNPASPQARAIVHERTERMLAQAPIDLFFTDDSGSSFIGPDGLSRSGIYYGFEQPGVEIHSDAQWVAAEEALFVSIARPAILNGGDATTWLPSYGGAFLRSTNVAGASREGCFSNDALGAMTTEGNRWQKTANALLATTGLHRFAVCVETGNPTIPVRTYDFASWLLTYDPNWSVLAPIWETLNHHNVFPEILFVPQSPLNTARGNIDSLKRGELYLRYFASCTVGGKSVGGCAIAVNPGEEPEEIPVSLQRYHFAVRLDARTVDEATTVPLAPCNERMLEPGSAIIVVQSR